MFFILEKNVGKRKEPTGDGSDASKVHRIQAVQSSTVSIDLLSGKTIMFLFSQGTT